MREVHPAFDPVTSTWFVGNREARTIRELLRKLGPDVVAIGYQPIGQARLLVLREPHDTTAFTRAARRAFVKSMAAEPDKPKARTDLEEERHRRRLQNCRNYRARRKVAGIFGVGLRKPLAEATALERARFTAKENDILDRWAAGETGPQIAAALGVKRPYVSANVVWNARLLGDPRAVVRNPKAIGKTRNKSASPTSGAHRAQKYRQRMVELKALREREQGKDAAP